MAIIERALLANTLVCLPTGLGKTLIAAVVMYNFFRWFPGVRVLAARVCMRDCIPGVLLFLIWAPFHAPAWYGRLTPSVPRVCTPQMALHENH